MISMPASDETTTAELRPTNKPFSTTPTIRLIAQLSSAGLRDRAEMAIEDEVAAVGHERPPIVLPQFRLGAELFERRGGRLPAELRDLDRHRRVRAKPVDQLLVIHHHHEPFARCCDDLLAQQCAAAALDQGKAAALDLVGAVDRQIDAAVLGEAGQRDAEPARQVSSVLGGRDRDDRKALRHPLGETLGDKGRGRAGAEPDDHAVLDELDGAFGGGRFR